MRKGVLLLALFTVYAVAECITDAFQGTKDSVINTSFIAGCVALPLTWLSAIFTRKYFAAVLFFCLVGFSFYFEVHPVTWHIYTMGFAGVTLFKGKTAFVFLLAYLVIYRNELRHFFTTSRLWN